MMNRKRGRPAKYVNGRDGKPIVGLSQEPKSQRFYATGTKPRVYFGQDFDVALMKFRAWESRTRRKAAIPVRIDRGKKEQVRLPLPQDRSGPLCRAEPRASLTPYGFVTGPIRWNIRTIIDEVPDSWKTTDPGVYDLVSEDAFFSAMRQVLLERPAYAAERTGIEQISYLRELKPTEPSLSLSQVANAYFGRKKGLSPARTRDQARYWSEFRRVVGVRTVSEITAQHMERYHEYVWDQAKKNKWSDSSIRHRLDSPKSFLRAALRKGRDVEELRRVIDLTAMFELPRKAHADPRPLTREEVDALLQAASTKWRAIILTALNLAMYPSEVAGICRSDIDWNAGTFVGRRSKTGVTRLGVMWERTIAAIRTYLAEDPHDGETLFASAIGKPYSRDHVGRNFRKIRKRAGLGDDVTFERIRDSAYSRAVEGGATIDEAKMLAGHKVGISDHYIKRQPRMVAGACAAIETYYFGPRG